MAKNLYRKDLFSHFGCVNAIEFSNDGQWLASGMYHFMVVRNDYHNFHLN